MWKLVMNTLGGGYGGIHQHGGGLMKTIHVILRSKTSSSVTVLQEPFSLDMQSPWLFELFGSSPKASPTCLQEQQVPRGNGSNFTSRSQKTQGDQWFDVGKTCKKLPLSGSTGPKTWFANWTGGITYSYQWTPELSRSRTEGYPHPR